MSQNKCTDSHTRVAEWPVESVSRSSPNGLVFFSLKPSHPLPLFPSIFQRADVAKGWRNLTAPQVSLLCLCGMKHMFPKSWAGWGGGLSLYLLVHLIRERKLVCRGRRDEAGGSCTGPDGDSPGAAQRAQEACLTRGACWSAGERQPALRQGLLPGSPRAR